MELEENKSSEFLTGVLIFLLVLIVGIVIAIVIKTIRNEKINKEANNVVDEFEKVSSENHNVVSNVVPERKNKVIEASKPIITNTPEELEGKKPNNNNSATTTETRKGAKRVKYAGYDVVGTIRIPKTKIKYPILTPLTNTSLTKGVAMLESTAGINEPGNTTILGHNYRNNMFFSKNDKLKIGDKIYIKDLTGREVEYEIYEGKMRQTTDGEYIRRETNGETEISLSTCNDDSSLRYVLLARKVSEK